MTLAENNWVTARSLQLQIQGQPNTAEQRYISKSTSTDNILRQRGIVWIHP